MQNSLSILEITPVIYLYWSNAPVFSSLFSLWLLELYQAYKGNMAAGHVLKIFSNEQLTTKTRSPNVFWWHLHSYYIPHYIYSLKSLIIIISCVKSILLENRSSVSLSMLSACLLRCQAHMARECGVIFFVVCTFCDVYLLWCPSETQAKDILKMANGSNASLVWLCICLLCEC